MKHFDTWLLYLVLFMWHRFWLYNYSILNMNSIDMHRVRVIRIQTWSHCLTNIKKQMRYCQSQPIQICAIKHNYRMMLYSAGNTLQMGGGKLLGLAYDTSKWTNITGIARRTLPKAWAYVRLHRDYSRYGSKAVGFIEVVIELACVVSRVTDHRDFFLSCMNVYNCVRVDQGS